MKEHFVRRIKVKTEEKGIMMKRKIMKERRKRETKNKERKEKIKGKRHELSCVPQNKERREN